MATATKTRTQSQVAADKATALQQAIETSAAEKLNADRLTHFAPLAGGDWAEFSAQVRYAESVLVQLIDALDITGLNGCTVAVIVETGKFARCYGRDTMVQRIDNGEPVVSIKIHISVFSLPFDAQVLEFAHALSHVLAYTRSIESGKPEFGMSLSATHNSKFADEFHLFGSTSKVDRTNKQNLPVELSAETKSVIDRMTVDHASVIVTGEATPKAKREPATVLRLACPTDAAHFATSNIEKRYKGKRPDINLDCGVKVNGVKCATKISASGYAKHSETK